MKLRIGIGIFFLTASIVVGAVLYNSIRTAEAEKEAIERSEFLVKEKLQFLKTIQESHYISKGAYAKDWEDLKNFCKNDILHRTERREEVITLYYGADSVAFHIDTLSSKNVSDSLFQVELNPNKFAIENLHKIPLSDSIFRLEIGYASGVEVFQITDTNPKNIKRTYGAEGFDTLRMGSLIQPAIKGNWEK